MARRSLARRRLVGLAFSSRLLAALLLVDAGSVAFSNLAAQVSPPSAGEISPTVNTEVSDMIHTGSGYSSWSGSVHRSVTDLEVPGAVSSLGLKWVRTYNSGRSLGEEWSFSYTWRYWGRGWGVDPIAVHLPDGSLWRRTEPGMKLRWVEPCGPSCTSGYADLYLEDGSKVHMDVWREPPEPDQIRPRLYWIDHYTPLYVEDPYGRRTTLQYDNADVVGNPEQGLRLKQVTDPSGRWIKITYACDNYCNTSNWWQVTRVDGSDGSWVKYTPSAVDPSHVDYSDGTSADYTYGDTTFLVPPDWLTGHAWKLITAQDTHADSPMQSIQYEYKSPGAFEGQIRAEHHYPSNAAVSTLSSNSTPTSDAATQTETRGDGAYSRTLYIQKGAQHVPLVKTKSDFNGVNEIFTYDSNNYLLTAKDRNGYTTTYTNEGVIGNPTQIKHPDGTHIDYTYSDSANPYHISTVTDELGKTTTYTRGSVGSLTNLITRIDYPDGAYETFAYNGFGQVLTHRRKNGAYDHAVYNSSGLLAKLWNPTTATSVTDADPHTTLTYYTANDQTINGEPVGNAWQDRVQTVTYPANCSGLVASETYEYDRMLDANGIIGPNGTPAHGRGLVTKITHADGTFKTFTYDKFGNKTSETDETAHTTTYTYDDYKRLKTVKNALSQTTSYDYTATNGASSYSHTTNSVRKVTSPTLVVTGQKYDNNFRVASKIEAEGSAIAATTTFGYDNNGNQTSMIDPRQKPTSSTYDNRNRKRTVTNPLNQTTTWTYDYASNVTRIDHPDPSNWEAKTYDEMHRVLTDTVPQIGGTSPVNLTTTFVYYPSGTLQQVTDPKGQVTKFSYDAADLKTKMTYPDNSYRVWTYDDVKNLCTRQTISNATTQGPKQNFTYDNRNRKIAMSWSNGADSATFTYDDASRLKTASNPNSTVTRTYDAAGRLTIDQQTVAGLAGKSVNYQYYGDGTQKRMYVSGGIGYDYTFTNDAMARFEKIFVTGATVPIFQYYYDPASSETKRSNFLNDTDQIYVRDSLNRMARRELRRRSTGARFSYEAYTYDLMSRLKLISREDGKSDGFGYYLDSELNTAQYGLITSSLTASPASADPDADPDLDTTINTDPWDDGTGGGAPPDPTPTPTPDPVYGDGGPPPSDGTMTSDNDLLASDPGSSAPASSDFVDSPVDAVSTTSGSRNVTYKLDRAGNRTSVADSTKATAAGYTPNVLNEYISSVGGSTITNNNQHQISLYRTVNYSYINDERLSTATSGINVYQLHYDALGRCVKRIVNGVTNFYIYDGEKAILEYSSAGAIIGRNLYGKGIDEVLMRTDTAVNSGQPFYYQQDHEGSVTHLTDGGGNVTEKYQYDAFGAPTIYPPQPGATPIPASAYKNRFLFTGREYSAMFGFYEYRARAYHPTLGRFTSEDPKLFDAGDYNLYRYCHNDPLDMTDPMGLAVELYVKPPYIGFSPMEGDAARIGGYFATKQAFQQAAQQALSMAQIAGAGGPNVNWRDTGNNNIRQPYVYGNDGRPLLARTYAEIQATGDANKDGSLKTLNVEFKIDAKYATTAGPNSQRFTQATEPIHERELRAWGMDSGRDLARSIVNKYSGSAQQAVTRANAALQGELRIKAWESHVLHDFPRPWGLGDHLTGHPYDW